MPHVPEMRLLLAAIDDGLMTALATAGIVVGVVWVVLAIVGALISLGIFIYAYRSLRR